MRPSTSLAKGFWTRSWDEARRTALSMIRFEGITGPRGPFLLQAFAGPDSIDECAVTSDATLGGFSTGHLEWVGGMHEKGDESLPLPSQHARSLPLPLPSRHGKSLPLPSLHDNSLHVPATLHPVTHDSALKTYDDLCPHNPGLPAALLSPSGFARFRGVISTDLPANPRVFRTGYAAWRTRDRPATLFGARPIDVDAYAYLALRVKSDGRPYVVNVQTESIDPADVHQHRLFARRSGRWETVYIAWDEFVRTSRGQPVAPRGMLHRRVRTLGIGLTDRVPGPFELCIAGMWAVEERSDGD